MTKRQDYWTEAGLNLMKDLNITEPKWCLHLRFADGGNPIFYRGLTVDKLVEELKSWNQHYKLWPEDVSDDGRRASNFIWIMAERRHE